MTHSLPLQSQPLKSQSSQDLAAERVFLAARWHGLAMINFEVDPALVEPLVPRGVELDFFQGRTYVSLVGFLFRDTRLLGCCVPWHRHFPEVNLRFYVRRVLGAEVRRGVAFIREIVPRWAIATVARVVYNEPYVARAMRYQWENLELSQEVSVGKNPRVRYEWRHGGAWVGMEAEGRGNAAALIPGSQAEFIAEHYWGYCGQRDGGTIEYRVDHPSWQVWTDATAHLMGPVADCYGPPFADLLRKEPTSTFLADGSAVEVYRPTRVA